MATHRRVSYSGVRAGEAGRRRRGRATTIRPSYLICSSTRLWICTPARTSWRRCRDRPAPISAPLSGIYVVKVHFTHRCKKRFDVFYSGHVFTFFNVFFLFCQRFLFLKTFIENTIWITFETTETNNNCKLPVHLYF